MFICSDKLVPVHLKENLGKILFIPQLQPFNIMFWLKRKKIDFNG